jgi:glucose-6-phosphate 1-dehydrogenase
LATNARVVVEKPFGRDLASARRLNRIAHSVAKGALPVSGRCRAHERP